MNVEHDATRRRGCYNRIYAVTQQFGYLHRRALSLNLTDRDGRRSIRASAVNVDRRPGPPDSKTRRSTCRTSTAAGDGAPTPIARYEEAQLIIAEAQGGAQAVTTINALRARRRRHAVHGRDRRGVDQEPDHRRAAARRSSWKGSATTTSALRHPVQSRGGHRLPDRGGRTATRPACRCRTSNGQQPEHHQGNREYGNRESVRTLGMSLSQ